MNADQITEIRPAIQTLFASVGILPPAVQENRQKATKGTKNRNTGALASLKDSVVRPAPHQLDARV